MTALENVFEFGDACRWAVEQALAGAPALPETVPTGRGPSDETGATAVVAGPDERTYSDSPRMRRESE
ncbi:MAG: hypothetical protein ACR2KP_01030 [Egibacteraceae bacterium]